MVANLPTSSVHSILKEVLGSLRLTGGWNGRQFVKMGYGYFPRSELLALVKASMHSQWPLMITLAQGSL